MKPGPVERTNGELDEQLEHKVKRVPKRLELEVMLRHTAVDLLSAARILLDDYSRHSISGIQLRTPVWSDWAAQAFEALELLGVNPSVFTSARELRPWVGGWSGYGRSLEATEVSP